MIRIAIQFCKFFTVLFIISVVVFALTKTDHSSAHLQAANKNCNIDRPFTLPSGCKLPFKGRTGLDVDKHCPLEGCAKSLASKAQDLRKNNYCSTSKAVELSFQSFTSLQSV